MAARAAVKAKAPVQQLFHIAEPEAAFGWDGNFRFYLVYSGTE